MTIDEAIEYHIKVATQRAIADEEKGNYEKWNETKFMTKKESEQIIADHRQFADWLTELKDLREENKVLTSECDRLIKEKGELLSKVSGGNVLKICQLEEQIKDWKEEYANLNKISYGFYKELKEAKELLKLTIDTNYSLHKSCCNCSHFTSDRNCDIGKYLYGTGEKECEWEWKHMGEIINFLHD